MTYQICRRCVMDTSVDGISFDAAGVCQFCRQYDKRVARELFVGESGQKQLEQFLQRIRQRGTGRPYDCLIGMSGGVDSTYVAYLLKRRYNLRPLALHVDNGWNADVSVKNIQKVLKTLQIDLVTEVLDWDEFKDLQVSFLRASIANAEIPTDHAVVAKLFRTAVQHNLSNIITGSNIVTEAIMPETWMYDATDWRLIKAIQRRHGTRPLKHFPYIRLIDFAYYIFLKGIRFFPILNYVSYNKRDAKRILQEEFGWQDYGEKHYESIYTRFFQTYLLPRKFGIDKRRAHYSTLILSGQMTREEALQRLQEPPLAPDLAESDKDYVIRKLCLSQEDFDRILGERVRSVSDYPNNLSWRRTLSFLVKLGRSRAIRHD